MKTIQVAFQGERGAYSEMAARYYFKKNISAVPCPDFEKVFRFVEQSKSHYGMVPIENSLTGSIHENYDLLLGSKSQVVGEIKLRIAHTLIALPGTTLKQVRSVYSHPQAILQCKNYLNRMKGVTVVPAYDTAGSVKMIRDKKIADAAAIASYQAAVDYNMNVLARNLESDKANFTRFLVLGHSRPLQAKQWKSSIVFAFRSVPGALFKCLGVFAMRDIDLLKIESRPIHGKPWAYIFYLDFKGNMNSGPIRNALNHLAEITYFIKELGSYPGGAEVEPTYKK